MAHIHRDVLECDICGYQFYNESRMIKHMKAVHTITCKHCRYSTDSYVKYREHVERRHNLL